MLFTLVADRALLGVCWVTYTLHVGIRLPAGDAQLATRCPLRMNMHNSFGEEARAELSYTSDEGLVGPLPLKLDGVPAAVQKAQAELTSDKQPISDTPLQLEIWAPGAPVCPLPFMIDSHYPMSTISSTQMS